MTIEPPDDRPDLPVLESVRLDSGPTGLGCFLFGLLLIFVAAPILLIVLVLANGNVVSAYEAGIIAVFVLAALLLVRVIRRSPWFDCCWETDSRGLTAHGFLRTKLIPWAKTRAAATRWVDIAVGRAHLIETDEAALPVPADDVYLSASIWQHLRRHGRNEGIRLSDYALTLWRPIPDEIPHETDWENPHPPRPGFQLAIPVATSCMLLLLSWLLFAGKNHYRPAGFTAATAIGFIGCSIRRLRRRMHVAMSFALCEDRFEAVTSRGHITASWDELESVRWQGRSIVLRAPQGVVMLPWDREDEESTQLVLAIIRRLRAVNRPVQLPIPDADEVLYNGHEEWRLSGVAE